MKLIESIEQWERLYDRLKENGWKLWKMQYDTDSPEGFHAWFWKTGKRDYEIVTYLKAVRDEIIKYNRKQKYTGCAKYI
jgi:hypothetical protein